MNVTELIEELSKIPGDTPVIVSGDEEGNYFNPLHSVDFGHMTKTDGHMVHPDDIGPEYDAEDVTPAVCIWP